MGERKLRYDDVKVGDQAPAIDHKLTRTDLVMYAGASGDFNPMHTDEVAAQAAGLPSVFGHGMFSAGLLATAVTNYVGIGNLTSYRVRFTKQTWPGETLSTTVAVTEKRPGNEIVLECALVNENGEAKIQGEAVAVLPARGLTDGRDALRHPDARHGDAAVLGRLPRGPLPRAALQRVRRGPLLPAAVLPEVLERRRRVEAGERARARSTRTRSCTRTTCRRSTSACRTSPRSSSSKRARA